MSYGVGFAPMQGFPSSEVTIGGPVVGGTANGVLYANASKLLTSEAAFVYNTNVLTVGTVSVAVGAVGTPAIRAQGFATTGIYFVNSAMGFASGGTAMQAFNFNAGGEISVLNSGTIGWSSSGDATNAQDTSFVRISAGIAGQKRSGTQQHLRVYDSTPTNYANITHDGTNGLITSSAGQLAFATAANATTATTGYFCLPTSAGAPTGVPANIPTGQAPCQIDTTNGRLYSYYAAAWHLVALV